MRLRRELWLLPKKCPDANTDTHLLNLSLGPVSFHPYQGPRGPRVTGEKTKLGLVARGPVVSGRACAGQAEAGILKHPELCLTKAGRAEGKGEGTEPGFAREDERRFWDTEVVSLTKCHVSVSVFWGKVILLLGAASSYRANCRGLLSHQGEHTGDGVGELSPAHGMVPLGCLAQWRAEAGQSALSSHPKAVTYKLCDAGQDT